MAKKVALVSVRIGGLVAANQLAKDRYVVAPDSIKQDR